MSKEQTLGPWTTEPARGMGLGYQVIEGLSGGKQLLECTEQEARLIAAAPELLAFAKSLINAWKGEGMPYPYKIALDASAAIAKATGETA